jgi:hypothetical protein
MIEELVSGMTRKFPVGAIALRFEGLPALSALLLLESAGAIVGFGNDPFLRDVVARIVLKRKGGLQSLVSAAAVGL